MNLLQSSFPLAPEPYAQLAAEHELDVDDLMTRTQRLFDERIIREITPIFDTRALGYDSMLVAAKVDSEHPHRAAKIINSHPGVSHNYLRTHEFNLWFTIATPPDSELGLQGTLEVLQELTGRRVDPPAADAEAVQDQHEPRDGEGHRRPRGGRGGGDPARARAPALRRHRHRRDPRAPGADGGRRPPLRRGRRRGRDEHRRVPRPPRGHGRPQDPAPRRRDPLPPPRRLLGQRHGRVEGPGRRRSSRSARRWPPCAGSRTATSARPTPTGPTRSSRWPTAARRRSATRSCSRSPTSTSCTATDRAVLYSSTEYKKIRLHYFTDDYASWEREHAIRGSIRCAGSVGCWTHGARRFSTPAPSA